MTVSTTTPDTDAAAAGIEDLTPRQIVAELDKYVVGQAQAKRAVAIAMRNRWRRQQLPRDIAIEIVPKNILMIGPTGVGKTEIARRLSRLANAPFIKIEASKFTEVGYVGRDVESMIRDLTESAVVMVREERRIQVREEAKTRAEERLLDALLPVTPASPIQVQDPGEESGSSMNDTREKLRAKLRSGALDERVVEIQVEDGSNPSFEMITPQGVEAIGLDLKEMMPGFFNKQSQKSIRVSEAREILVQQEAEKLIDRQHVAEEARRRVEESGIVFLDEIDKICARENQHGPDVSREGVQRDLLPVVEGTTVATKHGPVKTDHILFVGAGAFHVARPSDMIPELQGRFPIRVELEALSEGDLLKILKEPRGSLTMQYRELLSTEGLELEFTPEALELIASLAAKANAGMENIGARRLATLMEKLLEEVSFEAPAMGGVEMTIDEAYVERALRGLVEDRDISSYVL